jgi:hypothetical protein
MMINWWWVILSVLICDIWINILLQTSALVGPLYIVNWNARWNIEKWLYVFDWFHVASNMSGLWARHAFPTSTNWRKIWRDEHLLLSRQELINTGWHGHINHTSADMSLLPLASSNASYAPQSQFKYTNGLPQMSGLWFNFNIQSIYKSFCCSPITSSKRCVGPTEYGVHIVIGQEHCCTECPKGMLCMTNNGDYCAGRKWK